MQISEEKSFLKIPQINPFFIIIFVGIIAALGGVIWFLRHNKSRPVYAPNEDETSTAYYTGETIDPRIASALRRLA